ncbi:MAG: hypothetical protein ABJF88_00825 [Rhodothermales bacterium]
MNLLRYSVRFAFLTLLLPAFALTGCDSDSADEGGDNGGFPSSLTGLWGSDEDLGTYVEIAADGRIVGFPIRYMGPFACFEDVEDDEEIRIEPLGGDRYAIVERNSDGSIDRDEVTITVDGNRMTIVDEDDGDVYTETYTRWTQDVNACAFNLRDDYELESIDGEALPYSYTATGSTGQTHQFVVSQGEAYLDSDYSDVRASVIQTFPNGSSAGGYGVSGTISITSSAGAFQILPDEYTSTNYPGASATGRPTAMGVAVTLRHPELGPEPLELTYRRIDGDDFAAKRRLTPVR